MRRVKIASCQLPDVHGDISRTVHTVIEYATVAHAHGAKLVCFPECYLQGYVVNEVRTPKLAISLASGKFASILQRLAHLNPILVIGLIELDEEKVFNTAVVVKQGKLLGRYRKSNLTPGESVFEPGDDYPLFQVDGLRFGINICFDLNFPETAKAVADQGADLLVCPCNNMMGLKAAETWKFKHNEIRAQRTIETGLWLISSDVTGEQNGRVSYGPTAVINPAGVVVAQVPLMEAGFVYQDIPIKPADRSTA